MSRRGHAPHQPAAGTRQERPPTPRAITHVRILLRVWTCCCSSRCFSFPRLQNGSEGPRENLLVVLGQPLAGRGGGSRGSCGAGPISGSPGQFVAGFPDECMWPSPLEVTGCEPHGLTLGAGRRWPCGDSVHAGLCTGTADRVGEGFGEILIAGGTSHPGSANPDGARPPIRSQTDVMLQCPQRPPLCCHETTAAPKPSAPTAAISQRGTGCVTSCAGSLLYKGDPELARGHTPASQRHRGDCGAALLPGSAGWRVAGEV